MAAEAGVGRSLFIAPEALWQPGSSCGCVCGGGGGRGRVADSHLPAGKVSLQEVCVWGGVDASVGEVSGEEAVRLGICF